MKSPKPSFEAEIASAALGAVGRPRVPARMADALPPAIAPDPRRMAKPHGPEPDPDLFDIADVIEDAQPGIDADGRRYPRLERMPHRRERVLELALKDQWTELSARCVQIADLHGVQRQQAVELQSARTALGDLENSITLLQAALSQQENEVAAAKEALAHAEQEAAALRAQLAQAQDETAHSRQQAGELQAAFDERGAVLASARQKIELLAAALAAKSAEAEKLAAPIDEERRRHRAELMQQSVRYETELAGLARLLKEREEQLDTLQGAHSRVARRHEELVRTAQGLEAAHKTARDHVKSQAELIQVLEALLKVERDTAEGKIKELTAALDAERAARAGLEKSSAAMRQDIVHLLPKLVARRGGEAMEAAGAAKREDAA